LTAEILASIFLLLLLLFLCLTVGDELIMFSGCPVIVHPSVHRLLTPVFLDTTSLYSVDKC